MQSESRYTVRCELCTASAVCGRLPTSSLCALLYSLQALIAADPAAAQAAYGACILSFLGAPHWGLAIANYPNG